jgi:hypothetical protein
MRAQGNASKGGQVSANHTTIERDPELIGTAVNSSPATAFDIDRQSGATISNIGGDQTIYYGERGRVTRAGKALAAFGLLLSLAGFALLVSLCVMTGHRVLQDAHAGGIHGPYTQYVPSYWPAAAALLVGGFIFRRVVRIIVGR